MSTDGVDHTGTSDPLDDDDLQAAEYVLGTLDAVQREATRVRIAADAAFAARIDAWEAHFAPWLLRIEPVAVPERLWLRVRDRLGWSLSRGDAPAAADRRLGFWRGATALASAAAIAAIAFALRPPGPLPVTVPPPSPVQQVVVDDSRRPVTVLARDDGAAAWVVAIDADRGALRVAPVPGEPLAGGQSYELWLVPAGGSPQSLGAVTGVQAETVRVPDDLRTALAAGAALAVSLEPASGIPHAAPTGPIVAQGAIERI